MTNGDICETAGSLRKEKGLRLATAYMATDLFRYWQALL